MIRKGAIRRFLNRPRRDCRVWKQVPERELDARAARLPVQPPIWHRLYTHQKVGFLVAALARRFFLLFDMGTGKTLLIIALVRYFRKLRLLRRVLVLVPNRINKTEWVEQLQNHSPSSTYVVLKGSSADKWRQLEDSDSTFVLETYAGLIRMVCTKQAKKGKQRLVIDKKMVTRIADQVQGLVCDESFAIQNRGKLPFRVCKQIARNAEIVYPMTGTPFNRNPESLWSQMYLVDRGQTLGETLGLFRAAFFNARHNGWQVEYKFDRRKQGLLNKILANRSLSYEADQASLPAVVPVKKTVQLPEEAGAYYRRAVETIIASKGNVREMRNAFTRLRQISSGFVGYYDDDEGEKAKFEFDENPKLEMLLSIAETIRPEYKCVVFFDFTWSGERILRELHAMGLGAVLLHGKTKHVDKARDQFKYDRDTQFLVLQNQFGLGLNIQVAKFGIFYESPVSGVIRKQCRRRVERQHSLYKSVFLYDLLCGGTVDEAILDFHRQGRDLFNAIVRGQVKL